MYKYSVLKETLVSEEGVPFETFGIKTNKILIADIFFEKEKNEKLIDLLNICNLPPDKALEIALIVTDI